MRSQFGAVDGQILPNYLTGLVICNLEGTGTAIGCLYAANGVEARSDADAGLYRTDSGLQTA